MVRDPIIVTNPVSVVGSAGANVSFGVLAAGSPSLTYQWQRSATNIADGGAWSGTSSDVLSVTGISAAEAGTYRVIVSGGSGMTVTSSNATLTVLNPVMITNEPDSQTVVSGTNVSLSVGATGSTPISYQWRLNDVDIPGANLSLLSFPSVQTSNAGVYTVVVTNSINAVTSAPATLTVLSLPPAISSEPKSRTIAPGTRAVFVVEANGSLPLFYQWRRNGLDVSGATSSTLVLTNVQTASNATYTVVVTNSLNSITSAPAVLTVTTNLPLYETNLVVVRIGDGAQTLALTGNSIYLDQFTRTGSYINTITLPENGASALIATGPDLTGTTLTGTALTRTPNKKHLVIPGYHVDVPFPSNLNAANGTAVPRGIGLIDTSGNFHLALTDTTAYSTSHFRSAASDGFGNFWGAGNGQGTQYFGTNSAPLIVQTDFGNTRMVDLFNGELYAISSGQGNSGLLRFYGLPTAVTTVTNYLPGFTSANTTDFSFDPTGNTVYISAATTVQKWQFDGTIFTNAYALSIGVLARWFVVDYSGPNPVLYVTTSNGQLVTITDTDASATPTTLVSAGPNQLFKGIRFGPADTRPTIAITHVGNDVILTWSGPYPLLSAPSVTGPWAVINGATSPYTNSTASPSQLYFGLGN